MGLEIIRGFGPKGVIHPQRYKQNSLYKVTVITVINSHSLEIFRELPRSGQMENE